MASIPLLTPGVEWQVDFRGQVYINRGHDIRLNYEGAPHYICYEHTNHSYLG